MAEPGSELPRNLPIFPLTGTLLLPGNWLPLHIFEPRYRNMVEDAMAGERILGMIQPLVPRADNRGPEPGTEDEAPALYAIGCAGRIEECRQLPGGRFALALVGLSRFRLVRELSPERGYRRVEVDFAEFDRDLVEPPEIASPDGLLEALQRFGERHGFEFELDRLTKLPGAALVNGLAMALPFGPAEKQALLEAEPAERGRILLTLLAMGVDLEQALEPRPPVAN